VVAMVPVVPVLLSILLVLPVLPILLSSPFGSRAAASGLYRASPLAIRVLLVLLPESTRILPIRQELPGRVDEGGTADDSAPVVEDMAQ